ncbi:hypothetical protein D3C84_655740 [compost metagenome]
MTNPIDLLLPLLDSPKPAGPGKWTAFCPSHPDKKNPSLSIREADDGKVLLHCWTGCTARDIAAAVGLELRDLFPGDKQPRRGPSKAAQQFEAYVLSVGLALIREGTPMSAADLERFETAKRRLGVA